MEFRVIWEFVVRAEDPQDAAEQARAWQLSRQTPATVFSVWDYARGQMHRVDLDPPGDQLDAAARASLRSTLRRLQCAHEVEPGIKDLAAAMLIFLDAANGIAGRCPGAAPHL
jgi:hypothetical protein